MGSSESQFDEASESSEKEGVKFQKFLTLIKDLTSKWPNGTVEAYILYKYQKDIVQWEKQDNVTNETVDKIFQSLIVLLDYFDISSTNTKSISYSTFLGLVEELTESWPSASVVAFLEKKMLEDSISKVASRRSSSIHSKYCVSRSALSAIWYISSYLH